MSVPPPQKYSVELPNTRKPGQTGIYRSVLSPDSLLVTPSPEIATLYDVFQNGWKISPDGKCAGHRLFDKTTGKYGPYVWQTYNQVRERATNLGSGFLHLNETVVKNTKSQQWTVGIYAVNRPEWLITDQACHAYSLITVALYDTLGPETVEFVINHSEIGIVVCSGNRVPGLLRLTEKIPGMKVIVSMDALEDDSPLPSGGTSVGRVLKEWAADKGILLLEITEVEEIGKNHRRKHNPPSPNDTSCISYTSGTTGTPKGAIIPHSSFIASLTANPTMWTTTADDVLISYLPLAHIFGRVVEIHFLYTGGGIGYFHGDILALLDDIAALKPTVFPAVPRLLTRVYGKLQQATVEAPGIKGILSRKAMETKLANLEAGLGYTHAFWDLILFSKVRALLGNRVRLVLTGSAPISAEVLQFLRVAFVCDIAEGYGQTEGVAIATLTLKGENKAGHTGGPVPCCEVKLVDVPEMNYKSTDKPYPRGELCYRGGNMFRGFLKDEAKTRETVDSEGWLHSGDIAYIDDRGAITIIDRKKNIFKLSQGEYVAPEKIENIYVNSPIVLQIFVHGDSLRNCLVGIVVPDPESFVPWANKLTGQSVQVGDEQGLEALTRDERVREAVLHDLDVTGKHAKLRGFEFVKAIHLTPVPFSVENDLLTPSMKLKRHLAVEYFRPQIDQLYKELETSNAGRDVKARL